MEVISQAPSNAFDDPDAYYDFWLDKLDSDNLELRMYAVRQIELHQDRFFLMMKLRNRPNAVEKCKAAATFFWSTQFREGSPQSKVAGPLSAILHSWGVDFPNSPCAKRCQKPDVFNDPSIKMATMHYPIPLSPVQILAKWHPEQAEAGKAVVVS